MLHLHGDELSDIFSTFARVRFLIERQNDADAVRSIIRNSKDRFMIVMRGEFCFG